MIIKPYFVLFIQRLQHIFGDRLPFIKQLKKNLLRSKLLNRASFIIWEMHVFKTRCLFIELSSIMSKNGCGKNLTPFIICQNCMKGSGSSIELFWFFSSQIFILQSFKLEVYIFHLTYSLSFHSSKKILEWSVKIILIYHSKYRLEVNYRYFKWKLE